MTMSGVRDYCNERGLVEGYRGGLRVVQRMLREPQHPLSHRCKRGLGMGISIPPYKGGQGDIKPVPFR